MNVNPLPNHGKDVNAIDGELACRRKRYLSEVKFPMKAMFKVLFEAEVIQQEFLDPDLRYSGYDPEEVFEFHGGVVGHSIEKCGRFRRKVQ